MSKEIDVLTTCTPEQFGAFVKVPASEVRRLMKSGVLPASGNYAELSGAYIEHLRAEVALLRSPTVNPYPEHSFMHRAYELIKFDVRCTQGEFGKYVGISQQAVSLLVQKGVIHPEGTFLTWVRDYSGHLEDKARERRGY